MARLTFLCVLMSIMGSINCSGAPVKNLWSQAQSPTEGPSESIGFYDSGCLRGAQILPSDGPGYQAMRPSRRHFYGHPSLIAFIRSFARRSLTKTGEAVLIGDLSQPRGGPTMTGHSSHQTGLDVDIWFWQPAAGRLMNAKEREEFDAPSMVSTNQEDMTDQWNSNKGELLRGAAESPETERIFVNPAIKKELCSRFHGQTTWLSKIRPWWGHTDHFHVRLGCSQSERNCKKQDSVPPGDGCDDTLQSWFTPQAKAEAIFLSQHPKPPVMPVLPAECSQVIQEKPRN